MNNNEQLIEQIKIIIEGLTKEQAKLNQSSDAYKDISNAVLAFSNSLTILNGQIALSDKQLSNFASKMQAVLSGQKTRFTALGVEARTSKLAPIIKGSALEYASRLTAKDLQLQTATVKSSPTQDDKLAEKAEKSAARLDIATNRMQTALNKFNTVQKRYLEALDKLKGLEGRAGVLGTPEQKSPDVIKGITFDIDSVKDNPTKLTVLTSEIRKETASLNDATLEAERAIRDFEKRISNADKSRPKIDSAEKANADTISKISALKKEMEDLGDARSAQWMEQNMGNRPVRTPGMGDSDWLRLIQEDTKRLEAFYQAQLKIVEEYKAKIKAAASQASQGATGTFSGTGTTVKEGDVPQGKTTVDKKAEKLKKATESLNEAIDKNLEVQKKYQKVIQMLYDLDMKYGPRSEGKPSPYPAPTPIETPEMLKAGVNFSDAESIKQRAEQVKKGGAAYKTATNDAIRNIREFQQKLQELDKLKAMQNIGSYIPGGAGAARILDEKAAKLDPNFTRDKIKSVSTEPSSNITKVRYEYQAAEGVIKSTTFTVDKFGRVLVDTQRRFRGFFENVGRDILEALKWSIAIAAVYGPLNALNQLVDIAIKNQSALADVAIALGNATQSTGEIFQATADIAAQTGEELSGVVEAYNLAYKATGSMEDATTRFAVANKLLTDAIVLSKLSTLDQAESIDVLTAALRQTNTPLDQGTTLLDKWVAVTKVAGVDLTTLALGFSVLGEAADAVGLSMEELNAVIAIIAEGSAQSGKEIANRARALVAGFQSDGARQEMAKLGISFIDGEGKARSFLDIMKEISALSKTGVINPDQLSKLTLAIGGGSRGSATAISFIENLGKIDKLVAAQNNSQGAAAQALGKKLNTVETATTRLGNAFQELAQALGDKGGILDAFKVGVDLVTLLTKSIADLADVAGRAGPALIGTLGAATLFSRRPDLLNGGAGYQVGQMGGINASVNAFGQRTGASLYNTFNKNKANPAGTLAAMEFGGKFAQNAAAGGLAILGSAAPNFLAGRNSQGIGNIVGGIMGGLLGSAGGPMGTAIGASIGSAILEGMVNSAEDYKIRLSDALAPSPIPEPPKPGKDNAPDVTKDEKLKALLEDLVGSKTGLKGLDEFFNSQNKNFENFIGKLKYGSGFAPSGFSDTQALLEQVKRIEEAGGRFQGQRFVPLTEEEKKKLEELRKMLAAETKLIEDRNKKYTKTTPIEDQQISDAIDARSKELESKFGKGLIGAAAYNRGKEALGGFSATAPQFMNVLSGVEGFDKQTFLKQYSNITAQGNTADLENLNQMKQIIIDANTAMDSGSLSTEDYAEKQKLATQTSLDLYEAVTKLYNQYAAQATLLPTLEFPTAKLTSGTTEEDFKKIAVGFSDQALKDQVDAKAITDETAQAIKDSYQDVIVTIGDTVYTFEGTTTDAINKAFERLVAEGKALQESAKGIDFQTFDMSQEQLLSVANGPQYDALLKKLQSFGYQPQLEDNIAITTKDQKITPLYQKDFKVLQYLLQQILKTEEKQLDGMFNLPEGSSFWVPAQAAQMSRDTANAQGALDATQFNGGVSNFDQAVVKFGNWVEQMKGFRQGEQQSFWPTKFEDQMKLFRQGEQQSNINLPKTLAQIGKLNLPIYGPFENKLNKEPVPFGGQIPQQYLAAYNAQYAAKPTTQSQQPTGLEALTQSILTFFKSLGLSSMTPKPTGLGVTDVPTLPSAQPSQTNLQDIGAIIANGVSNLTTRLNLTIDSRTVVQVDGRQLAAVVKQYLKSDLLNFAGGTGNRSVSVI
jgi:TP901 family phage tail tape measure protein